jgi:AcrR family transcriptional regulator
MPRSGDEARKRLHDAALALYLERGYDATTTANIAERAGVNHRTFFRHFPDKREVLFSGESDLREALELSLTTVPAGVGPLQALLRAFIASAHVLEDNRESGMARLRLIAATPALRERDLAKAAMITDSLAGALTKRGESSHVAHVAAAVGWATFHEAATNWIAEPGHSLEDHLRTAFNTLERLSAPGA